MIWEVFSNLSYSMILYACGHAGQPQVFFPLVAAHHLTRMAISCYHMRLAYSVPEGKAWDPCACLWLTCQPHLKHYKSINLSASSTRLFLNSHLRGPNSVLPPAHKYIHQSSRYGALWHGAGCQFSSETSSGSANIILGYRQTREPSKKFGGIPQAMKNVTQILTGSKSVAPSCFLLSQDLQCHLSLEGLNSTLYSSPSLAQGYLLPEKSLQLLSHAALSKLI